MNKKNDLWKEVSINDLSLVPGLYHRIEKPIYKQVH